MGELKLVQRKGFIIESDSDLVMEVSDENKSPNVGICTKCGFIY